MIELSLSAILLLDSDGRAVPFDPERLRSSIAAALESAGSPDSELASDIAMSIEFALRSGKKSEQEPMVRSAEVDAMTCKVLNDIGYSRAAAAFRTRIDSPAISFHVDTVRIRSFLEREFSASGADLDSAARKVCNTLQSIGADSAAPALILELGKHFLTAPDRERTAAPVLSFHFSPENQMLAQEEIENAVDSPSASEFLRKRILSIHRVDLRLFPVLRFNLRLSGLVAAGLVPPITELAVSPALLRVADAMDNIAAAADKVCAATGHSEEVPLKTALCFTDASVFVRDFMGCALPEQTARCAESLAQIVCGMTARRPIRVTCR